MGDNPGYPAGLFRLGQKRNSGKVGEIIRRPSRASAEILPLLFLTTFLSPPVFFEAMFLLLIFALPGAQLWKGRYQQNGEQQNVGM